MIERRTVCVIAFAFLLGGAGTAGSDSLPCRQPQLATDGNLVYLACGAGSAVQIAVSSDGGRTFGSPTTIATVGALALEAHPAARLHDCSSQLVVNGFELAWPDHALRTTPHAI